MKAIKQSLRFGSIAVVGLTSLIGCGSAQDPAVQSPGAERPLRSAAQEAAIADSVVTDDEFEELLKELDECAAGHGIGTTYTAETDGGFQTEVEMNGLDSEWVWSTLGACQDLHIETAVRVRYANR